jgi:hypothetical protein
MNTIGTIHLGSADLQTSTADAEILSVPVLNFKIMNTAICTISINGGAFIYIRALQGYSCDYAKSVRIHESAIAFNWSGIQA